jgi:hypothetical protein
VQASRRADASSAEVAAVSQHTHTANRRADEVFAQLCTLTKSFEGLAAATSNAQAALQRQVEQGPAAMPLPVLREISNALNRAVAEKTSALSSAKHAAEVFMAQAQSANIQVRIALRLQRRRMIDALSRLWSFKQSSHI